MLQNHAKAIRTPCRHHAKDRKRIIVMEHRASLGNHQLKGVCMSSKNIAQVTAANYVAASWLFCARASDERQPICHGLLISHSRFYRNNRRHPFSLPLAPLLHDSSKTSPPDCIALSRYLSCIIDLFLFLSWCAMARHIKVLDDRLTLQLHNRRSLSLSISHVSGAFLVTLKAKNIFHGSLINENTTNEKSWKSWQRRNHRREFSSLFIFSSPRQLKLFNCDVPLDFVAEENSFDS